MPSRKKTPETRGRQPYDPPYPTVRKFVSVPGILGNTLEVRWTELFYAAFSPYALELVCYDFNHRRTHPITGTIAQLPACTQENADREIVRYFKPNSPEPNGALIHFMFDKVLSVEERPVEDGFRTEMRSIRLPDMIWECVPIRVKELGYESFSSYVTGLIRFDLMVGGPHRTYTGKDMDIDLLRRLNEETVRNFHSHPMRKTRIDFEVERMVGRVMTPEEREAELVRLTEDFVRSAAQNRRR